MPRVPFPPWAQGWKLSLGRAEDQRMTFYSGTFVKFLPFISNMHGILVPVITCCSPWREDHTIVQKGEQSLYSAPSAIGKGANNEWSIFPLQFSRPAVPNLFRSTDQLGKVRHPPLSCACVNKRTLSYKCAPHASAMPPLGQHLSGHMCTCAKGGAALAQAC